MPKFLAIILLLLGFGSTALCQAMQTKNIDGTGLIYGYDRFKDVGVVRTKNMLVTALIGKKNLLDPGASMRDIELTFGYVFQGQKPTEKGGDLVLAIIPDVQTKAGRLMRSLDSRTVYLSLDSEVIFLVDDKRLNLGKITKTLGFDAGGNFDNNGFVAISPDQLRVIAEGVKVEMAVGNIAITVGKPYLQRIREFLSYIEPKPQSTESKPSSSGNSTSIPQGSKDLPGYRNGKPIPIDELNGGKPKKP